MAKYKSFAGASGFYVAELRGLYVAELRGLYVAEGSGLYGSVAWLGWGWF